MKIENNTIIFKSTPENYPKEKHGLKPSTIRRICFLSELREIEGFYKNFMCFNVDRIDEVPQSRIKIINSLTGESFERTLTDITIFEGLYIFSWRHE